MMISSTRFPYGVRNSSLMSFYFIIANAWEACLRRAVVDRSRSCGGARHALPPSCSQFRWLITIITVVFLAVATPVHSQSSGNRTQLDTEIYQQAFSTLNSQKIRTGQVYDVYNTSQPSNTTTLQNVDLVQAVRLRTHSLRIRGFRFNEINMPIGITVAQTVPRSVVLLYRRFNEYQFYNASAGNTFVSPVVGILVYNAADISNNSRIPSELTMIANISPIKVQLESTTDTQEDEMKCAWYNNTAPAPQNGTASGSLKNFTSADSCSWTTLGDFSLVGPKPKGKSNAWKIGLGAALGGVGLALLLFAVVLLAIRYRNRARFKRMEHKADEGETLQDAKVGSSRAPAAGGTRTKGKLEKSLS